MNGRAIGIDIGGTKIAAGVVDLASGTIERSTRIPTPVERGGDAVLAACMGLVGKLNEPDAPIGIAVPELVGPAGEIQSEYQFDWQDIDVAWPFAGQPVTLASDVRAAAAAEARFGAGRGASSLLFVAVGTGISSTFVVNGVPWPGARGHAIVLTSGDLAAIDPASGTLVRSVLEEWAAGPALVRRYEQRGGEVGLNTQEVLVLAERDDPIAAPLMTIAADALGSAIGQAVNLLDPELVVIGGGLGLAGGTWWDHIVASARRSIWSEQVRTLPILPAGLGEEAGLIGAALATGNSVTADEQNRAWRASSPGRRS